MGYRALLNVFGSYKVKTKNMSFQLTTAKFLTAIALATVMIFGGAYAVTTATAQAVTLQELVELFISLGIISADKADAARSALSSSGTTGGTTSSATCSTTFTQNLKQGATGAEVMALQKFLNSNGFTVATSGAGSAGSETSTFGPATKAAVIKFQNQYASDVLTPVGLSTGTGYWGASSRAKANTMCSTGGNTGGNTGGTTTGMLTVASASQPTNSLAPEGASRVPFTRFTLTNNSSVAVAVNGVTVELTGLAQNAVFAGVTLVDSNNVQYGIAKTLNSVHQATIGDTFTLNAGESKTFTVAGNMASNLDSYAGQVAAFSVVGINTTATLSGSLPITGAYQTMNATLTVGTFDTTSSAYDPSTTQAKNIGDTAVRFSGLRFTANAEDARLYSIRWRQSGNASSADLSNLMTYVDGTAYPVTVDATGKYYTTSFSGGLLIEKGFSKDLYIQGDITGSGAAGRDVAFDIDKASDVYMVGQTYGYGITENGTMDATDDSGSAWFNGWTTNVSAGSATTIAKANEVAAQNIALNVANQPLGGFATEFKGESVSVQQMVFFLSYGSAAATGNLLTNVSLVNENGAVVASSVDGVVTAGKQQKVTFSDTVTFPTGRHVYTLKGKVPSTISNNETVTASSTPGTDWTSVVGQTSGNTVSLTSNGIFTMNVMTVKSGSVALSVSPTPAAQNVVAGVTGFTVANIQLDATQSGEDVRFANMKLSHTETSLTGGDITNCFAWDGSTRLNSTAVNPTTSTTEYTYVFDSNLIATKGTVKTIAIKCDIPSSLASGSFSEGFDSTTPGFTGTGVSSGTSITPTIAASNVGQTLAISTGGSLTVASDASTPTYTVAAAGTTGVTLGVLKFHANNEDVRLDRVALQMSNVAATSSPKDLTRVTLWDGSTQVGTALFTGDTRYATSTLTTSVTILKDSDKLITIKGDLSAIGTGQPGDQGALVQVNFDGNDTTGTQGIGMSSGSTVNPSSSDTTFAGVRVFRSYPTIAETSTNGSLTVGTGVTLERFSVTANSAGGIGLYKFTVNVATSSASTGNGTTTVNDLKVYAYTDSGYSNPVSGYTNGQVVDTIASLVSGGNNEAVLNSVLSIPAGTTYYFAVKGTVAQVSGTNGSSGYVTTKIGGDAAYPVAIASLMGTASGVDGDANDNFIWSPNATTTSASTHVDWTNGYLIPGLPTDYINGTTLSK